MGIRMYTYIVIDDEELTRKGTIAKLKAMNDTVSCIGEANDGQEALGLIEQNNPDIIITDMNMPNMSGSTLLPLLTEKYSDKPIIVISGYKDFDYTKQAIKAKAVDYLLKPFGRDEIQTAVQNAISYIEDSALVKHQIIDSEQEKEYACYEYDIQTLRNMILGYHTDKKSLTSKKLSFMNTTHNLMLITLHTGQFIQENDMTEFLNGHGFGDLALYLQHNNNKHLGFFILFIPEQSILSPETLCRQIAKNIILLFETLNIPVSIGISNIHNEITELNNAFLETVNALNCKKLNDLNKVYFYNDIVQSSNHFYWDKQEELMFRVEAGMINEVKLLVHELFEYFSEFPDALYMDIKYYCFQLSDMTRLIMTGYLEQLQTQSVSSSTQNILNTMFDLNELEDYYSQFFANIANILSEKSVYATDDVIEKIKIYVEKNYYKNLTIELLSCFFYMNRSYLSHLFKEKTGDTFVNYLNTVRLDKAKQLLLNTDKKMYQIAKSVGYDNVKYFFRVFKKFFHVTPEQFRNINK